MLVLEGKRKPLLPYSLRELQPPFSLLIGNVVLFQKSINGTWVNVNTRLLLELEIRDFWYAACNWKDLPFVAVVELCWGVCSRP